MPLNGDGAETVCPSCGEIVAQEGRSTVVRKPPPDLVAGRYKLLEQLGKGAAGIVYRAWDTKLEEETALKILRHEDLDAAEIARFKREITIARKVTHPSVIRIHDFGESGDDVFISMELLTGGTLAEKLHKAILPDEGISIAIAICEGVHAAHAAGVVHRDLKPENILFDAKGRPRVADFGLARPQLNESKSGFSGTPFYMSPEHANAAEITTRSDVYSLGVVLFQMFTGRLPFMAESFIRLITLHCNEPPPLPRSLVPELPAELEAVILRALAKDPKQRHATAGDLAADLLRVYGHDAKPIVNVETLSTEELEVIADAATSTRAFACSALEQLAKRHAAAGNVIEQAKALERMAGRMTSGSAEPLTIAGELFSATDPERAIRCWERAVGDDAGCVRALEHLVVAHEERMEWHPLLAALNQLIAAYKDANPKLSADSYCKKGVVLLHHLGVPEKAKQHFRLALQTFPAHVPAMQALAAMADDEGDKDTARTMLQRMVALGVPEAAARLAKLSQTARDGKSDSVMTAWTEAPKREKTPAPVAAPAPSPATSKALVPMTASPPAHYQPRVEEDFESASRARRSPALALGVVGLMIAIAITGVVVKSMSAREAAPATPAPTPIELAAVTEEPLPATSEPTPAPTPEEIATPAPTPEATVVARATPRATKATPTPTPKVVVKATPTPVKATPTPTPVVVAAVGTPPPTPVPFATSAPTMDPRKAPFEKGNALLKEGKINEAVRELKKAVKADDAYADGHFFLAAAYVAKGEDAYACDELTRYLQLAPGGRYASQAKMNVANCR